jgi:cytochrome c
MSNISKLQLSSLLVSLLMLSACAERIPPDSREPVTLALYTQGDADRGASIYKEACSQCHQLNPGLNKKGPQLMNIYGAPAADLADYTYSEGLASSGWVWDAETLDPYIADSEKAIIDSKMLADPMPDATERADVIAYLSTLRAAAPEPVTDAKAADAK